MEPEIDPDAVVVDAMTAVANRIMSRTELVYDVCMSTGSPFDPVLETAQWAGAAYVLWLWISDIEDDPRGVQDPKECERQGVLAASEWLANDHTANSVTAYFERWAPAGPLGLELRSAPERARAALRPLHGRTTERQSCRSDCEHPQLPLTAQPICGG